MHFAEVAVWALALKWLVLAAQNVHLCAQCHQCWDIYLVAKED